MIWLSIIWLMPIFIILLWLPQNVHHEGSHALAAKLFSATDVKIYPFPEWSDSWFPDRFAHMTYKLDPDNMPSENERAIISFAPQLTSTFWIVVLILVLIYVNIPLWLYTLVSALIVVNFIDASVNLSSVFRVIPKDNQDTWNFIKYIGIKVWLMRIIILTWYMIFGSAIFIPWHMLL